MQIFHEVPLEKQHSIDGQALVEFLEKPENSPDGMELYWDIAGKIHHEFSLSSVTIFGLFLYVPSILLLIILAERSSPCSA